MSSERLIIKGRIFELKKQKRTMELEGAGNIILIRNLINPYEDNILNLKVEEAQITINRLAEIKEKLKEINEKIEKLEAEL